MPEGVKKRPVSSTFRKHRGEHFVHRCPSINRAIVDRASQNVHRRLRFVHSRAVGVDKSGDRQVAPLAVPRRKNLSHRSAIPLQHHIDASQLEIVGGIFCRRWDTEQHPKGYQSVPHVESVVERTRPNKGL